MLLLLFSDSSSTKKGLPNRDPESTLAADPTPRQVQEVLNRRIVKAWTEIARLNAGQPEFLTGGMDSATRRGTTRGLQYTTSIARNEREVHPSNQEDRPVDQDTVFGVSTGRKPTSITGK
jgi:hypothetical protein